MMVPSKTWKFRNPETSMADRLFSNNSTGWNGNYQSGQNTSSQNNDSSGWNNNIQPSGQNNDSSSWNNNTNQSSGQNSGNSGWGGNGNPK